MNQAGRSCRICRKKCKPNELVHIFALNVNGSNNGGDTVTYFEAIQQLTGIQIDYANDEPNKICEQCQNQIKYAYRIRTQLINALQSKPKKSIEIYQIIATSDEGEEVKFISGNGANNVKHAVPHDDLITIAGEEIEFHYEEEQENEVGANECIEENSMGLKDSEEDGGGGHLIEVDQIEEESSDPLDAVSFLLDKKDLFMNKVKVEKPNTQKRIHQCQVCEKTFMRKSNLVDHLRLHANVRLYSCEYCQKAFVQAGNYRSHLRIHTKERPYKCTMCPKTYNQSSALKVHVRSHTNEKNYVCDICEKRFTNSSDLNKHKRVHDPSLKIKCNFCDKTFAQSVNLKNHVNRHHQGSAQTKPGTVKTKAESIQLKLESTAQKRSAKEPSILGH